MTQKLTESRDVPLAGCASDADGSVPIVAASPMDSVNSNVDDYHPEYTSEGGYSSSNRPIVTPLEVDEEQQQTDIPQATRSPPPSPWDDDDCPCCATDFYKSRSCTIWLMIGAAFVLVVIPVGIGVAWAVTGPWEEFESSDGN